MSWNAQETLSPYSAQRPVIQLKLLVVLRSRNLLQGEKEGSGVGNEGEKSAVLESMVSRTFFHSSPLSRNASSPPAP